NHVTSNNHQYGIFGAALALVAWFSGAAICIVVGACAGPGLAEDPGPIARLGRGRAASRLVEGALPPLPPPVRSLRLADAVAPRDDDIPQEPERPTDPSPVERNPDDGLRSATTPARSDPLATVCRRTWCTRRARSLPPSRSDARAPWSIVARRLR